MLARRRATHGSSPSTSAMPTYLWSIATRTSPRQSSTPQPPRSPSTPGSRPCAHPPGLVASRPRRGAMPASPVARARAPAPSDSEEIAQGRLFSET